MGLSAVTLYGIVSYLKERKPRYLKKFRISTHGFYMLKIRCEEGDLNLVVSPEQGIFIPTTFSLKQDVSRGFTLNLKRLVEEALIKEIQQVDSERIVLFSLIKGGKKFMLYIELFSKGNIVLTDDSGKIIAAQKTLKAKDRLIYPGRLYKLPPSRGVPVDKANIGFLTKDVRPQDAIISLLVGKLSIDKHLVKEALVRSNVPLDATVGETDVEKIKEILERIKVLIKVAEEMREGVFITYENSIASQLLLFKPSMVSEAERFEDVLSACDRFLVKGVIKRLKLSAESAKKSETEKREKRILKLKEKISELKKKREDLKRKADYLSSKHTAVQKLIEFVDKSVKNGRDPIGDEISSFKIIQLDRKNKKFTFSNSFGKFSLGYDERNAFGEISKIYEEYKKIDRGIEKLKNKVKELENELSAVKERKFENAELMKERKKKWYEKFRWFVSSDNIIIVGGKDAKTNEFIVRKLAKKDDILFHADTWKGPFVLVPVVAEKFNQTLKEAATFTASFSNAWREKIGSIDVYWVKACQLSKKAPAGEYLRKGAFIVHGKRNYVRGVKLELAIGLEKTNEELRIMVGPPTAVHTRCFAKIDIIPGERRGASVAEEVVTLLTSKIGKISKEDRNALVNELLQLLPPGGVEFVTRK